MIQSSLLVLRPPDTYELLNCSEIELSCFVDVVTLLGKIKNDLLNKEENNTAVPMYARTPALPAIRCFGELFFFDVGIKRVRAVTPPDDMTYSH